MANFEGLVNEFRTITTNFTSTETFIYNELNAVDWDDRSKEYPAVLFDAKNIEFKPISWDKTTNLPIKNEISGKIYFFDVYGKTEEQTISLHKAMSNIQVISNQWIAELIRRNLSTTQGILFLKDDIAGSLDYAVHSDDLVRAEWNFSAYIFDSTCSNGIFLDSTCDPATVQNSDLSYSQSVASGATLSLPDIIHIDSDGTPTPTPAQTVFIASTCATFADATVSNSDSSVFLEVASGGTGIFSDSTASNSNGSVTLAIPAGSTGTFIDSSVSSTGGTFKDSFPSGENYTIADTSYTDSDGTPLSVEYNTLIVCSTVSETHTLLYYFVQPHTASYTRTITAAEAATYNTQTLVNCSSATYRKNGSAVTLPFTVANTDTLLVKPVFIDSTTDASVQIDD